MRLIHKTYRKQRWNNASFIFPRRFEVVLLTPLDRLAGRERRAGMPFKLLEFVLCLHFLF